MPRPGFLKCIPMCTGKRRGRLVFLGKEAFGPFTNIGYNTPTVSTFGRPRLLGADRVHRLQTAIPMVDGEMGEVYR